MELKRPRSRKHWYTLVLVTMLLAAVLCVTLAPVALAAEGEHKAGGEANIVLPDLRQVSWAGMTGQTLLTLGMIVVALGLLFGAVIYTQVRKLPVHKSMREISELIYQTCRAYLTQQGKFLAILWVFIAIIIGVYFGVLQGFSARR
jgi:K(+)-stimulated pyrophosphate-energized sodium pump